MAATVGKMFRSLGVSSIARFASVQAATLLQKVTPQRCTWCGCRAITSSSSSNESSKASGCQLFSTSVLSRLEDQVEHVSSTDIAHKVNSTLTSEQLGRLFAVVHIGASQRKVTVEDIIIVHGSLQAECGERIRLEKVLMVGSKDFTIIGRPLLSRDTACVEATVIEKRLDQGKVIMRFRKRKRYKRMYLHRQPLTYLRINSIDLTPLNEEID